MSGNGERGGMGNPALVDPGTVRRTAAEAWSWGHPLLEGYRLLYPEVLDEADPGYVGGFGRFGRHRAEGGGYARAWLDLRTEPWVLELPAAGPGVSATVQELDSSLIGTLTCGARPVRYLIAGARHDAAPYDAAEYDGAGSDGVPYGDEPYEGVLRADGRLVRVTVRAEEPCEGGVLLLPLSAHHGEPPAAAPEPVWPVWRDELLTGPDYFVLLDFLLGFLPLPADPAARPAERDLRRRLAELGIGAGDFEPAVLPVELREEMLAGIREGRPSAAAPSGRSAV
ncbi:DUF1254 domain-containing protein [Kitasatospora sp. NPDC051853]|uniref:DUF1254 domain-containing protein n=1 Tax=Kitasatospora sp. NPDC051853 TaxID=3364058 RepID=UPI0037AECE50